VTSRGRLVAVAGFWDKGATTEAIRRDRSTGVTTRSRSAYAVDWGWAPGHSEAFARLLRGLAARAGDLGRTGLLVCEPAPGVVPDTGVPVRRSAVSLFTPTVQPPVADEVRGLYVDLLYL
jgi:hypothetical protein